MKTYAFTDALIEICGLSVIDPEHQRYWRMTDEEGARVSESIRDRSKTAGGARVRFRTNSKTLHFRMALHTLTLDPCMAVSAASGADVLSGIGVNARYLGLINPANYENRTPELTLSLDGSMQQITVNLPRNDKLAGLWITVEDDAEVLPPLPFGRKGRLCFYGSSITEGGCATRPGNAYTAAVSRWLDMDYYNFGFSGAALGEDAMADILNTRDFDVLICDYDYNAPDAAHLEKTHARFFSRIRAARPDLPVLFMSRPDYDVNVPESVQRRAVILRTYQQAVAAGDKNVYFLDGEQFFGTFGREMCTVDGCHPNDLGFYRMAEAVYRQLIRILPEKGNA